MGSHLGLLAVFDLGSRPFLTLALLAVGFTGLWLFLRGAARAPGTSVAILLLVAALLRLILLPLPPTLSNDIVRYVWDGRVATAGFNPYELEPDAAELSALRNDAWEAMPHKGVPTVYPPVALGLFSLAARLPQSVYVLKALLALLDLTACFLLIRIARRRGLGLSRVAAYAWNPLVTMEIAGMGHVDALGVTAMIGAVAWLGPGAVRVGRAGFWAGVGMLSKLVPVVALPMWSRQSGSPWRFIVVASLVAGVGFLPLIALSSGSPPGLVRYAVAWEFNGPLFEPLWRSLEWIGAPDAVARALDEIKQVSGRHEMWNRLYPYRYPQFLAKLMLWTAMMVLVLRSMRRSDTIAGTGWLLGGVMLCSATVYPWYLLWVLPWAALCRQRAWLVLSGLICLSYLPQTLNVDLFPWFYVLIWGPFALLLMRNPSWSTD